MAVLPHFPQFRLVVLPRFGRSRPTAHQHPAALNGRGTGLGLHSIFSLSQVLSHCSCVAVKPDSLFCYSGFEME